MSGWSAKNLACFDFDELQQGLVNTRDDGDVNSSNKKTDYNNKNAQDEADNALKKQVGQLQLEFEKLKGSLSILQNQQKESELEKDELCKMKNEMTEPKDEEYLLAGISEDTYSLMMVTHLNAGNAEAEDEEPLMMATHLNAGNVEAEDEEHNALDKKRISGLCYFVGFCVWVVQMALVILILCDQIIGPEESDIMKVWKSWFRSDSDEDKILLLEFPSHTPSARVLFVQFIAIIIAVYSQSDIFDAMSAFTFHNPKNWKEPFYYGGKKWENSSEKLTRKNDQTISTALCRCKKSTNDEVRKIQLCNIVLPNTLKIIQGSLVLVSA